MLTDHIFVGDFSLPNVTGNGFDDVRVSRPVTPATRVEVNGWSAMGTSSVDVHVDEWRALLSEQLFQLPAVVGARPTVGQLWGQLLRTSFGSPTKSHPSEPDWESGIKLGYLLGLDNELLSRAGDIDKLYKQRKALRAAVNEGALSNISLDEATLRSQIATTRRRRDRDAEALREYRVDDQYAEHQQRADALTGQIRVLNEEGLALARRASELSIALAESDADRDTHPPNESLANLFQETEALFPERVRRRYEEVERFHESVLENRRAHLEQEHVLVSRRLIEIQERRTGLGAERASAMVLLEQSVAFETFSAAQSSLGQLESQLSDLERQLEAAASINGIDGRIQSETGIAMSTLRAEIDERQRFLEGPISLFHDLGEEIYSDRAADLLIAPATRGILRVAPTISGDASDGIRSVETFLLDIVVAVTAAQMERAPAILIHDSHLFDSVDHRQVASCLNIGARLAAESGLQYIVTMNSDFLASVASEGAFDSEPYLVQPRLDDSSETGGLFGFRFE